MKHCKTLIAGVCLALLFLAGACGKISSGNGVSSEMESQSSTHEKAHRETSSQETSLPESESETDPETEPTSESESETETKPETEPESETISETVPEIVFQDVNYSAVATQNVRMRTSPAVLEDNVYGQLNAGEGCTVIGYQEEWCKVEYKGTIVYIASKYLKEGEPETETQPPSVSAGETGTTVVFANGTTNTLPTVAANGRKVAIDAGHQIAAITDLEPNGPGSTEMKKKLSSGTQGCSTRIPEYELNLQVSLLLKQELLNRGYEVFMIRENNDCPISNAERAVEANKSGSDIFVRIHANGSSNAEVNGGLTVVPTNKNAYVANLAPDCYLLGNAIADHMTAASGFYNKGVTYSDTMTGINWCTIPVAIVEMGYMSNPQEDERMAQDAVRQAIARGIADGIDAYFAGK